MGKFLIVLTLLSGAIINNSLGQDSQSILSGVAHQFIDTAYWYNKLEIKEANFAFLNVKDGGLKSFASQLSADHVNANRLLTANKDKKYKIKLKTTEAEASIIKYFKSSSYLDQIYTERVIADNEKLIALYEQGEKNVDDTFLTSYIRQTLPVLRDHLKSIESISLRLYKKK